MSLPGSGQFGAIKRIGGGDANDAFGRGDIGQKRGRIAAE